jgi:hypothetical protein
MTSSQTRLRVIELLVLAGSRRRYFNSHASINANSKKPDAMLVHATHPDGNRSGRSTTAP